MAAGWAGDDEGVSIKITSDADVADALKAVRELDVRLTKLGETLKKVAGSGNKGLHSVFNNQQIDAANQRLKAQIDLVNKLGKASDQEAKSAKKVEAALKAEAKAVEQLTGKYKDAAKQKQAFTTGFGPGKQQRDDLKKWQKEMASAGTAIVGQPKTIEMARNNFRSLRENLSDVRKAGIANLGTMNALEKGTASAFTRGLTSGERFRVMLGVMKKDAHSLFKTMELGAKNMQWTGMQMMQGMTLPIIGIGAVAVSEFDKFNKQMFQLKKVTEFDEDYEAFAQGIEDVRKEFGLMPSVVAGAFKDVAALGITGTDNVQRWVEEISKISVLGEIDMSGATEFARSVNTLFGQDLGAQMGIDSIEATALIMADLNAISDATSLQLGDLAEAFPKVAPVMKALNFNANETAASIAAMHTAGIDASEGANALKTAMFRVFGGVGKGKEMLDKLGVSMFDANGNVVQGTEAMLRLGEAMSKLNDQGQIEAMYDLVGIHQGARTQAYWDDMLKGYKEYKDAMANDGLISQEEFDKFESGWIRAMGSSGEIKVEFDMTNQEKYQKALDEYMKDPSKKLAQFKSDMSMFLVTLGDLILPSLIEWQERFIAFLDKIKALPAALKKGIVVVALMAAAMGPLIYATAQAGLALSTFGRIATKVLPSTYKDITGATARKLFEKDPNRTDIGQVGDRVVQFDKQRKMSADMKVLTAAQYEAAEAAGVLEHQSKEAADAIDDMGDEAQQTSRRLDAYQKKMYGSATKADAKKGAAIRQRIEQQKANLAKLDDPNFGGPGFTTNKRDYAIKSQKADLKKSLDEFERHGKQSYIRGQRSGRGYIDGFGASLRKFNPRNILAGINQKMSAASSGFKNSAMFDGLRIYSSEMKRVRLETSNSIGGMKGQMLGFGKASAIGFSGAASAVSGFLLKLGLIGAALAVVIGIGAVFYMAIKNTENAGERIKKKLEPALKKLKESFALVVGAVKEVLNVIGQVVGGFDASAGGAEKAAGAVDWIGDALAKLVELVSIGIKAIAAFIFIMEPLWKGLGYMIKNVMGMITSLIEGDWRMAFQYFAAFAYEGIRPVIMMFDKLIDVVVIAVQQILNALGMALQGVTEFIAYSTLGMIDFTDEVAGARDTMDSMFSGLTDKDILPYFDQLRELPTAFGQAGEDSGVAMGEKIPEGLNNGVPDGTGEPIGEKLAEEVEDGMAKGIDFSEFYGKVKSALDEQIAKLRESLMKSMEDAHNQEMAAYDAKLKAIDDIEKAEERLYAEQEYLSQKREMLYRRAIDVENYQRDRALAIYEGRTDDARMLDLEQEKNTHDFNKEIGDLEEQRRREIVKQQREEEREIINKQKSIAEKRYEAAREGLEKELDLITKYTPRNVAEMNAMLGQLSDVAKKYHITDIPLTVQTGTDMWMAAIKQANQDMIHDFAWSGETAITSWLAAFINPEVMAVLIARATEMKDGYNDQINQIDPITSDDILDPNAPSVVSDMMGGLGDTIKNAIGGIGEASRAQLENAAKGLVVGIANMLLGFAEAVVRIVGGMINGIVSGAAAMARGIGWDVDWSFDVEDDIAAARANFDDWKNGYLGVSALYNGDPETNPFRHANGYAAGGVTSGPGIVGEGSNPREYVIPMDSKYRGRAMALTSSLLKELGGGTYKMPGTTSASINKSISSASAAAAAGAGATIYVDTFIGEEEWFKQMANKYDAKVGKKKAKSTGSAKRVINSYNQNNRGSF